MRKPIATVLLLLAARAAAQVTWTPGTLEAALSQAKTANKVVVLAVHFDGEPTCDELIADHYKDARITKVAGETINLFVCATKHGDGPCPRAPGIACSDHIELEKSLKPAVLKPDDEGWIPAPQHVWLGPDGKIVTSVPSRVTKPELEWAWYDAIRRAFPGYPGQPSAGARAPIRLLVGSVREPAADETRPPTREELAAMLEKVKKGMQLPEIIANLPTLVRLPDDAAQKFLAKNLLATVFVKDEERAAYLHAMGKLSPAVYWDEVVTWITYKDDETVRREAVIALEQIGEKKAADPIIKAFAKESSDKVKGDMIRAVCATAGSNGAALGFLKDILTRTKPAPHPEAFRHQLALGLPQIEDRPTYLSLTTAALKDAQPKVRSAAVRAIAVRRERELLPLLRQGVTSEKDNDVNNWMIAAIGVLEGRDARRFADFLKEEGGDTIMRDRR